MKGKQMKGLVGMLTLALVLAIGVIVGGNVKKENGKRELLDRYNGIFLEAEKAGEYEVGMALLPEIVEELVPALEEKDYAGIVENKEYCDLLRDTMIQLYEYSFEENSDGFEEALVRVLNDETNSYVIRNSAAGRLKKDEAVYVDYITALYEAMPLDEPLKANTLKKISFRDKDRAILLGEELLKQPLPEDDDLAVFAKNLVKRLKAEKKRENK